MSLDLAIKQALKNPIKSRGSTSMPRVAAVLSNGYNTYTGNNSYRTHPLQARFAKKTGNPERLSIHAELAAIVQAVQKDRVVDFSGYTMYVARVFANGKPALAAPCPGCLAAITEFGITNVEYTV